MKRISTFSILVLIIAFAIAITTMFSCIESEKTKTMPAEKYPVEPEIVICPQFDKANRFNEGLAAVEIGGKLIKWGYINKIESYVIIPQFDEAGYFSEGLASVEIGGKWGYIKNPLK